MNISTRQEKIDMYKAEPVEDTRKRAAMRASRLGRLIDLHAPDFIVELELRMFAEAFEALRLKLGYDVAEQLAKFGNE